MIITKKEQRKAMQDIINKRTNNHTVPIDRRWLAEDLIFKSLKQENPKLFINNKSQKNKTKKVSDDEIKKLLQQN
ncbi:hypothetical protein NGB74_02495 [Staphylococcus chromogenes]|uniref:hypothetical protein n=1 Tax=Staphylococcus chromogenes TaxID=46126 RepID=UPI002DB5F204|nr:hypothetical protein [Staphylococcus chromogenes]MEB7449879.1 hypothetical protein [Staphylococcus chromogenes]